MIFKTGTNVIGSSGCKLLAKMNILSISIIYLGSCQINNEAVRYVAKANWPKLQLLNICIHFNNVEKNNLSIDAAVGLRISSWPKLEKLFIFFEQAIAGLEMVSRISCNSNKNGLFSNKGVNKFMRNKI